MLLETRTQMPLGGGMIYCKCQSCGKPVGRENLICGMNGDPPIFTPLENGIYSRVVFGIHRNVFQTRWVPLILEAIYFCNFCEWRPKDGPQKTIEEATEEAIVQEMGNGLKGKPEYVQGLGCWIIFSQIRERHTEEVFNYQVSFDQFQEILAALKNVKGNPFKIVES